KDTSYRGGERSCTEATHRRGGSSSRRCRRSTRRFRHRPPRGGERRGDGESRGPPGSRPNRKAVSMASAPTRHDPRTSARATRTTEVEAPPGDDRVVALQGAFPG